MESYLIFFISFTRLIVMPATKSHILHKLLWSQFPANIFGHGAEVDASSGYTPDRLAYIDCDLFLVYQTTSKELSLFSLVTVHQPDLGGGGGGGAVWFSLHLFVYLQDWEISLHLFVYLRDGEISPDLRWDFCMCKTCPSKFWPRNENNCYLTGSGAKLSWREGVGERENKSVNI